MGRLIDLSGKRFDRLLVIERVGVAFGEAAWRCVCDCGNTHVARSYYLRTGQTRSCGCYHDDVRRANGPKTTKHGMSFSPEYRAWSNLIDRCENPNNKAWVHYGGRGISVCHRWRSSFEAFYADMGARPDKRSIDRIDVNGNYEPSNCRWATASEQAKNQRRYLKGDDNG